MNWQTFVIAGVIVVIVLAIIIKGILNKKKGKSSCACGCQNCPSASMCHKK